MMIQLIQFLGIDSCPYYQNPGMGNQVIWRNNTLTGTNKKGLNRMMIMQICNVEYTDNRVIDMIWITEAFGVSVINTYMSCPARIEFSFIYERNTFVNT